MRAAAVIWALAFAALLGCAGLAERDKADQGEWTETPQAMRARGKSLVALGQAGPAGQEPAETADLKARERLAVAIDDYTHAALQEFLDTQMQPAAGSAAAEHFTNMVAGEVTSSILRRSPAPVSWRGASGMVSVLYRLPISMVNDQIVESAGQCLDTTNPFDRAPAQVASRLRGFLDSRFREQMNIAARQSPPSPVAPQPGRTPSWLTAGRLADYPTQQYLSAIGFGSDPLQAQESVRRELAAVAQARLRGVLAGLEGAEATVLHANVAALADEELRFSTQDLVGVRIVETWHDAVTDIHYALGVLERSGAALVYGRLIRDAFGRAQEGLASVQSNRESGNYLSALADALRALEHAREAVGLQLKGLAVAAGPAAEEIRGLLTKPVAAAAQDALNEALSEIKVLAAGGDGQWLAAGGSLPEPLLVRVVAGPERVAVPGAPVRLDAPGHQGPVASAVTDEAGIARCSPMELRSGTATAGKLMAQLDIARLTGSPPPQGLPYPSAQFQYVVRSRANTRIAVYIHEGDARAGTELLTQKARRALEAEGFTLVDQQQVMQHVRAADDAQEPALSRLLDEQSLRSALPRQSALLLAVAKIKTEIADEVTVEGGTLYIARCTYSLRIADADLPATRATLAELSGAGQGAYVDDPIEAARRAREATPEEMIGRMVQQIRARLPATGPPR